MIPATEEMHKRFGDYIYSSYGFLDAFNRSFTYDIPIKTGRVVPDNGWVGSDYIGIDQGPILTMIANYRDDFVWNVMKKNPHIRKGLERAGFTGGWLAGDEKDKDDKDKNAQAEAAKPAQAPGQMDAATARALGTAESRVPNSQSEPPQQQRPQQPK